MQYRITLNCGVYATVADGLELDRYLHGQNDVSSIVAEGCMASKPLSVEQMCRELLRVAIDSEIVSLSTSLHHPQPKMMTAGDLAGMANLLMSYLNGTPVQGKYQ